MSTTAYCEPNFMIITYGGPIKYTSNTTFATDSWDDCVKECRLSPSCVLAHSPEYPVNCKLYDVNTVFQVKKLPPSRELLVAFKVSTNTCPAVAENPPTFGNQSNYGVASNNMANYTYEISYGSDNSCTMSYTALPVCPDGWTMFSRPTTKWCILVIQPVNFLRIQIFFFQVIGNPDTMFNYPEAQSYCESRNSTVTGLETAEERDFIANSGVAILGSDYPQFAGFWVSGIRKSECYADGWESIPYCTGTDLQVARMWIRNAAKFPNNVNETMANGNVDDAVCEESYYESYQMRGFACGKVAQIADGAM
ncbi:unnamed protein product [Caenorhabditis nigoni]